MTTITHSVKELETLVGVPARTLRHWIRKRLLPKPLGRGRGARYTEEHLQRACAIRDLRAQRASLKTIHARLSQMSAEQLADARPRPSTSLPDSTNEPPPAPSYPLQTWDVITLIDGLVLLVNSGARPVLRRLADEIYRYYGGSPRGA
jgi:DNA-binding transcriptional MerR regulator